MSSVVAPAFQFYARDWIASSTRAMSLAARGAYTDLLAFSWLNDGLQSDPDHLRRLVGATVDEWATIWPDLEHEWPVADDGKRRNDRQEEERASLEAFVEQCARGGRRSAEVRAERFGSAQPPRPSKVGSKPVRPGFGTDRRTDVEPSPNTALASASAIASTEITKSVISVAREDATATVEAPPHAPPPRPPLAPLTQADLHDQSPREQLLDHWRQVAERYGVRELQTWSGKVMHQAGGLVEVHPLDVLKRAVVAFWESQEFSGKRNFGLFASQAGQLVAHVRSGAVHPFGAKVVPRAGVHGSKTTQNAASLAAFVDTMRRRAAP